MHTVTEGRQDSFPEGSFVELETRTEDAERRLRDLEDAFGERALPDFDGPKRILVVTPDILPVEGCATTGAGLRAWGLGQGLRSRGHEVLFAMPRAIAEACGYRGNEALLYDQEELDAFIEGVDPDVILFQHWPMVGVMREPHRSRIIIDFHGPLLLETLFREPEIVETLIDIKLRCLARADFFVCAGSRQRYYYLAYLLLAGFDIRRAPIATVPFSLSPDGPSAEVAPRQEMFVYGGVFLPWQDPVLGLKVLVGELEAHGRGELHVFGGQHPWMNLPKSESRWTELRNVLSASSSVEIHQRVSRDELIANYGRASIAWDLMSPNPERELAFTSRTVEYLWCGLPVVYNDYAELAEYISTYDAGWTVDPDDEEAIRAVVRSILADPSLVEQKRQNAYRLVRERLSWDATIEPLDAYCRSPRPAERTSDAPIAVGADTAAFDGRAVLDGSQVFVSPEVAALLRRVRRGIPPPARRAIRRAIRAGTRAHHSTYAS